MAVKQKQKKQPQTSKQTKSVDTFTPSTTIEIPTHNLYNLALLDPPKYGWCASGGIINIIEPHEKARRKSTQNDFFIRQRKKEREDKKKKLQQKQQLHQKGSLADIAETGERNRSSPLKKKKLKVGDDENGSKEVVTEGQPQQQHQDTNQNKTSSQLLSVENKRVDNGANRDRMESSLSDSNMNIASTKNNPIATNTNTINSSTSNATDTTTNTIVVDKGIIIQKHATSDTSSKEQQQQNSSQPMLNTDSTPLATSSTSLSLKQSEEQVTPIKPPTIESENTIATSLSTSTIKTRNQGQKTPSTGGIKKRKKKRKVETLEFSALVIVDETVSVKSDSTVKKQEEEEDKKAISENANDKVKNDNSDSITAKNSSTDTNIIPRGGTEGNANIKNESIDVTTSKTVDESKNENGTNDVPMKNVQQLEGTNQDRAVDKGAKLNNEQEHQQQQSSTETKITASATTTKITRKEKLDPLVYHRGRDGQEPRDKHTGVLLCPTEGTDTNHDWDEPNLKLNVTICFPLVDTDELFLGDGDDNENDEINNYDGIGTSAKGLDENMNVIQDDPNNQNHKSTNDSLSLTSPPVRRNARRGNQNKSIKRQETILQRRLKREAKIKALPHFKEEIQWDLSNQNYRTPLIYASDIAVEYGLSLNQTLDLARSIQEQIDEHVRANIKYKIPISSLDPLSNPRKAGVLQPPEYYLPKVLYGGHGASNIVPGKKGSLTKVSDEESDTESESEKHSSAKAATSKNASGRNRSKSGGGKNSTTKNRSSGGVGSSGGGRRSFPNSRRTYDVCPKDELPTHDLSNFPIQKEYADEVLLRLRNASKETVKALKGKVGEQGETLGETYIIRNHNCHICHTRKPECVIFPCGNTRHAYCDLHCSARLGFKAKNHKEENLDYCPICSLQCVCSKCTKGVAGLALSFKKVCERQKVGLKEAQVDDIMALKDGSQPGNPRLKSSKAKAKNNKRARPVKPPTPKVVKRTKVNKPAPPPETGSTVTKVPACEFPSEICDGVNFDPSLEDDYRTVFTPEGSYIRNVLPSIFEQPPQPQEAESNADGVEDGNVDYCHICKKIGGLLCCDKCPRAFHHTCLQVNKSDLPDRWECPRCSLDATKQDEDTVTGDECFDKLVLVFKSYEESEDNEDFWKKIMILSKIQDVIQRLLNYDFGYIFAAPVSVREVPDYRQIVKRPMDLGTIKANIIKGTYNNKFPPNSRSSSSKYTPLEMIILEILKDIELVWHNCLLYNREGTSYYRMAKVMSQKCVIMRQINIDGEISHYIRQQLGLYVAECKQSRQERANDQLKANKPWIPFSKHQFKVASIKRGIKKAVAVFDPATNMIVKQYTSIASAGQAAIMIQNLGFQCELNPLSQCSVKAHINKSSMDPSVLIFGYRWLRVDDLRSGQFAVGDSGDKPIIRKVCSISNGRLAEFDTVENAYQDWLGNRKTRVSLPSEKEEEKLEYFIEKFLKGNEMIDGISWNRINADEKETERKPMIKLESDGQLVQHEKEAKEKMKETKNSDDAKDEMRPTQSGVKLEPSD